ncbi:4-(cytidine 5'-diphospho)-2-C-methyl-D-erythritol kinase [soil metagenome]
MGTQPVLAQAPAKINLALHVGPLRPDGYHDLATVYQAIDLHDQVRATLRSDPVVSVETVDRAGGPVAGVSDDHHHLAVLAAQSLRARGGVTAGVHLHVRKNIPVAAGLAGGSADAAAALLACTELWGLGLDRAELLGLAAELGSDVPFALAGETALGAGRGEQVRPLTTGMATTWLLISSTPGLATPSVYAQTDRMREGSAVLQPQRPHLPDDLLAAVRSGEVTRLGPLLHNDLQPAALHLRPGLANVLAAGRAAGSIAGLVSGSGPTVLLLVADDAHADAVAGAVAPVARAALNDVQLRTVHGPVAGARLVSRPSGSD